MPRRPSRRPATRMLSGYRGRPAGPLPRLDTHVDLIDWRGGRRFAGAGTVLGALVDALAARRGAGDPSPAGVLSHHLVHDAATWRFLEDLLAWGADATGVRWVRPARCAPGPRTGVSPVETSVPLPGHAIRPRPPRVVALTIGRVSAPN